jgi:hypothetical protein
MTLRIMPLKITTLRIMTVNATLKNATIIITIKTCDSPHNSVLSVANAECHNESIMLNAVILNVGSPNCVWAFLGLPYKTS